MPPKRRGGKAPRGGKGAPPAKRGRRGGKRAAAAAGPAPMAAEGPGAGPADSAVAAAKAHWDRPAGEPPGPLDAALVERLYEREVLAGRPQAVAQLDLSQYLEKYLWAHFKAAPDACGWAHVMSMAAMVNQKVREGVGAWAAFSDDPGAFAAFMGRVVGAADRVQAGRDREQALYLVFVINAFRSLENEFVRGTMLKLVSLPLWFSLSPGRLELELNEQRPLQKHWAKMLKREEKAKKKAGAAGHVPLR